MPLKSFVPSWIGALSLALGIGCAFAAPVTLTVDSSASALGGVPLDGNIAATFDPADRSLTFAGGSDIFATANVAATETIPTSGFFNGGGATVTAGGSFLTSISNLHLDLTAGTATDAGDGGAVTFASSGIATVSGVLDVDSNILGQTSSATLTFTAWAISR